MGDPFSIFATAAGLAGEGLKLSRTIYTFIKEVRGADGEAHMFVDEIKMTSACLRQFGSNLMNEKETKYFHPDFFEKTRECVASCQDIFGQLRTAISDAVPGIIFQTGDPVEFVMRRRDQLQWPFTRIQIVSFSKRLRKSKADLHLMVDLMMYTCNQQREKEESNRRSRHQAVRNRQKKIEAQILETKFLRLKLERDHAECALDDPIDFLDSSSLGQSAFPTASRDPFASSFRSREEYDYHTPLHASLDHSDPSKVNGTPRARHADHLTDDPSASTSFEGRAQANTNGAARAPDSRHSIGDALDADPALGHSGQNDTSMPAGQMSEPDQASAPAKPKSEPDGVDEEAEIQGVEPATGLDDPSNADQRASTQHKGRLPRLWMRLKPRKLGGKDRQLDDWQGDMNDPRNAYEARIWRVHPMTDAVENEPLPFARDVIIDMIKAFRSKGKSVPQCYERLSEELRTSVSNYLDDINHLVTERWSIAAMTISPKRARFYDIDSVTVAFRWSAGDIQRGKHHGNILNKDQKSRPTHFLKLKDAIGRTFIIPWETASTWKGIEGVIRDAFMHIESLENHVFNGWYDLNDPKNAIILPQLWDKIVQPGWTVSMHMWPMGDLVDGQSKKEKPKKAKSPPKPPPPPQENTFAVPPPPPAQENPFAVPPPARGADRPIVPDPSEDFRPSYLSGGSQPPPMNFMNDMLDNLEGPASRSRKKSRKTRPSNVSPMLKWTSGGIVKRKTSPPRVYELSDTESSVDQRRTSAPRNSKPIVVANRDFQRTEAWAEVQRERNQANFRRLVQKEGDSLKKLLERHTDNPQDLLRVQEEHKALQAMMGRGSDPLRDLMRQYTVLDVDRDESEKPNKLIATAIPEEEEDDNETTKGSKPVFPDTEPE